MQIVGFTADEKIEATTLLTDLVDSTTPFISSMLNRRAYKTTFKDAPLSYRMIRYPENDTVTVEIGKRDIEVYADPVTRQLLKLWVTTDRWEEAVKSEYVKRPLAAEAEEDFGQSFEVYHGLAAEMPKLTFVEVLNAWGTCPVFLEYAVQIEVMFLDHEEGGKRQPVWMLQVNGISTRYTGARYDSGGLIPAYITDHLRVLIADDGEFLYATNFPSAE